MPAPAETRTYNRFECVSFRTTDGKFGGLSNMAPGFPLSVNGISIRTSEALYQACRFPHLPDVQTLIIAESSPMTAKMKSKPFRKESRADWDAVRVKVMRWCLRVKLAQNLEKFGSLLLETTDRPIVEDSRKDDFWGAKPLEDGTLVGMNVLGRLLMELREQVRVSDAQALKQVEPPLISTFLLLSKPIGLVTMRDVRAASAAGHGEWTQASVPYGSSKSAIASHALAARTTKSETTGVDASARSVGIRYPRRLIEVDLPIRRISAHARREKSIRHGHISTLHIWWARRPLASCRAVICAALWLDPADPQCPSAFRESARKAMLEWTSHERQRRLSAESRPRFEAARKNRAHFDDATEVRGALLDFIADFADWDNSNVPEFLETSRALTTAAHSSLGGAPASRPLVVDPFAGGGSIPLEALRIGADAFASDLNPIPVVLNKVVLEYIPTFGQRLAAEVRTWGERIKEEADQELVECYPKDPDGGTPIAYLWARTIDCEGPGCGTKVPLIRSLWLVKKSSRSVALRILPRPARKAVDFQIIVKQRDGWVNQADLSETIADSQFDGTVKRGSATCPCCRYTTPVNRVRHQLKLRRGGTNDAQLMCVVTEHPNQPARQYRLATPADFEAIRKSEAALDTRIRTDTTGLSIVPNETISLNEIRRISVPLYGMTTWGDLFTHRQALVVATLSRLVRQLNVRNGSEKQGLETAVKTCLAMTVNKLADYNSSLCTWHFHDREKVNHTFARQAIPFVGDFVEVAPFGGGSGNWRGLLDWTAMALENQAALVSEGRVEQASATASPLPSDCAQAIVTDPPYYDAIPYSHLSDFFYVLFRRTLAGVHGNLFVDDESPKSAEIVVDRPHELSNSTHDIAFYERELTKAFAEARRVLRPDGICTIVFASKTTSSWEAILKAVVDAEWIITGSWPIDTEMETRVAAQGQARLASSVHLVCRPRENPDGIVRGDQVGDWREVLSELPRRIHDWMPHLSNEGVVGADAIFACLGPALEIFSRYSRVERANGEVVALREYLEQVWAAVSREALSMIFADPETAGLDEDARVTAMWLWTIAAPSAVATSEVRTESDTESDEESTSETPAAGYMLEFDAARKIAQGLGAQLEALDRVVQVKGDKARLLSVAERTKYLFGGFDAAPATKKGPKKRPQRALFEDLEEAAEQQGWGEMGTPRAGSTTLDRVHQSMILFGAGRGEALKRFLIEEGVGRVAQFWKLAQALSALYPAGTDEKRWVDGVLARKKGLGF